MLQRYARGFLARLRARALRGHAAHMRAFEEEAARAAAADAERQRRREIERRMQPRTAADFEVLYNELEAWRRQEARAIAANGAEGAMKRNAHATLLHKVRA